MISYHINKNMKIEGYIAFMKKKHSGQKRKPWISSDKLSNKKNKPFYIENGIPNYSHLLEVCNILMQKGFSKKYQIVGLFHDLLKSTDTKYEEILNITNKEIADLVEMITKKENEKMPEYIKRIKENETIKIVKIADTIEHLNQAQFDSPIDKNKIIEETEKWYLDLSKGTIFEEDIKIGLKALKEKTPQLFKDRLKTPNVNKETSKRIAPDILKENDTINSREFNR